MNDLVCRPATIADVERFYGHRPPYTMRALVVERAGTILGVIGVARHAEFWQFFSGFKPELREHLRCHRVLRTVLRALELVRGCKAPVIALAQCFETLTALGIEIPAGIEEEVAADRLLKRLGFEPHSQYPGLFVWHS